MSSFDTMQQADNQVTRRQSGTWGLVTTAFLGLLSLVLLLSSCASRVFYTQDYRTKVEKAEIDPTRLQFYNDKEFLIRRRTDSTEVNTTDGIVSTVEGTRVQDIRVRRGTPCRVDSVAGNYYWVRFEIGDSNVIKFYKNSFDYYQIAATKWVRGRGAIRYGGRPCEIERIGNDCLLLVKNYQKFKDKTDKKYAKGFKVGTEQHDTLDTPIEEEVQ